MLFNKIIFFLIFVFFPRFLDDYSNLDELPSIQWCSKDEKKHAYEVERMRRKHIMKM